MFKHHGEKRTLSHNLQIASLLSFVAGLVNVAGFLAVQQLTTNVTGHFAFFADEMVKLNFSAAFIYFLYIWFFFIGAFISSFLVEYSLINNENNIYTIPIIIEILILFIIVIFGPIWIIEHSNLVACSLLFTMGLQNSLVTKISDATVRTTHLTGLFTDLAIELSQIFFYKQPASKIKLYQSIKLRLTIISFFFTGGIIGGIFYTQMKLYVLLIAVLVLTGGLVYDYFKLKILVLKRKHYK